MHFVTANFVGFKNDADPGAPGLAQQEKPGADERNRTSTGCPTGT